jgi:hypothetical protein
VFSPNEVYIHLLVALLSHIFIIIIIIITIVALSASCIWGLNDFNIVSLWPLNITDAHNGLQFGGIQYDWWCYEWGTGLSCHRCFYGGNYGNLCLEHVAKKPEISYVRCGFVWTGATVLKNIVLHFPPVKFAYISFKFTQKNGYLIRAKTYLLLCISVICINLHYCRRTKILDTTLYSFTDNLALLARQSNLLSFTGWCTTYGNFSTI